MIICILSLHGEVDDMDDNDDGDDGCTRDITYELRVQDGEHRKRPKGEA